MGKSDSTPLCPGELCSYVNDRPIDRCSASFPMLRNASLVFSNPGPNSHALEFPSLEYAGGLDFNGAFERYKPSFAMYYVVLLGHSRLTSIL